MFRCCIRGRRGEGGRENIWSKLSYGANTLRFYFTLDLVRFASRIDIKIFLKLAFSRSVRVNAASIGVYASENGGSLAHPPDSVPAHSEHRCGTRSMSFILYLYTISRRISSAGMQSTIFPRSSSGHPSVGHSCVSFQADFNCLFTCW